MREAEFDRFADEYYSEHARSIAASGETPEFFHAYKVEDALGVAVKAGVEATRILDFGAGVGNSVPYFRRSFPGANLTCVDVSSRSLNVAAERFGTQADYKVIEEGKIPLPDNSVDMAFSACVFHHIDHAEHVHWLAELNRVTRPGGCLVIFEHNPLNPLTRHVVNTCPFDENAVLIPSGQFVGRARTAGWREIGIRYRIFFPRIAAFLRPLESSLAWLPLGGQYYMTARAA